MQISDFGFRIFRAIAAVFFIMSVTSAFAQESPTPSVTATPSSTPPQTPAARSVRISFLPPPLEGKISLGIYNQWDRLVRVVHQEAELDEFTIGADALVTKWDGKDDDGYDVPTGTYRARGYVVAPTKIEESEVKLPTPPELASTRVTLVTNPLEKNERPSVDLAVGLDDENVYLKTADGLPVLTIAQTGDAKRAWMATGNDKAIYVFLEKETGTRQFRVTGLAKMMAFDCGDFELK